MKAPAFQMYARDWLANVKLRRCSPGARGAWIDVMCLMHGSDEYGVLRWPLVDIARAVNAPIKLLRELADRDVLKGADEGAADYIHVPRHAGKDGEPVTLLVAGSGPVWYCSRFLRDDWVRQQRGAGTRFGPDNQPASRSPKSTPSRSPTRRVGEPVGDGPAVASASAENPIPFPSGNGRGAPPQAVDKVFAFGVPLLTAAGVSEKNARSMLGLMRKQHGDDAVADAIERCAAERPLEPVAWLQKALKVATPGGPSKQEQLERRNAETAANWSPPELRKDSNGPH